MLCWCHMSFFPGVNILAAAQIVRGSHGRERSSDPFFLRFTKAALDANLRGQRAMNGAFVPACSHLGLGLGLLVLAGELSPCIAFLWPRRPAPDREILQQRRASSQRFCWRPRAQKSKPRHGIEPFQTSRSPSFRKWRRVRSENRTPRWNGVDLKIESFQIFGTPAGANRTRPGCARII
jgi:hypothetical protein